MTMIDYAEKAMWVLDDVLNRSIREPEKRTRYILFVFPAGAKSAAYLSNGADRRALLPLLRSEVTRIEREFSKPPRENTTDLKVFQIAGSWWHSSPFSPDKAVGPFERETEAQLSATVLAGKIECELGALADLRVEREPLTP